MSDSAEYKAFMDCHSSLITGVKQSPKDVSDHLLPFEILAPNDRDYIKNDTHDDGDKARRILYAVLLQIENDPRVFQSFISALNAAGNFTRPTVQKLNDALQRQNQEQCDPTQRMVNEYETGLLQPLPELAMTDETGSVLELPTMDDGDTLPDPLEYPPDDAEVGADLRAAATNRKEAPTVDSFEGRLLQTFRSGESIQAIELLSEAESQSIDLRGVSDVDGKTLLHLACRNAGVDWKSIVCSLVEKHHCDVAAVDEDWNMPLHEAYQCGNLLSVEYLLSLPSCNPDAINKHEYTVLRMALEKYGKKTVAQLLATGRVDPRKGSSCGHTYSELLEMNQLEPQPQDYDGSALQMVIQFAKCMEGSNHVRQPFTSYCLRDILNKILKNCKQVSIATIVHYIKDKMLPLPANPEEIHDLLIDIQSLSDEFEICGEPTNVADIQINRKGDTSGTKHFERDVQQENINASQNATVPADIETPDYSSASDVLPILQPSDTEESMEDDIHIQGLPDEFYIPGGPTNELEDFRVRRTVDRLAADISERDVQQQSIELVPILSKTSEVPVPAVNDPGNDEDESAPLLESPSIATKSKGAQGRRRKYIFLSTFFGVGFGSLLILLGFYGYLYNGYSLVGTTNVAQIHRQSVPLIGTLDNPSTFDSVRFSEPTHETHLVPISFYTIHCSSFINVEINETENVNFGSPTDKSKPVTEWYLLGNTTLTVDITTEVVPNYLTDSCIAFLFIFDDFNNFLNFTSSSSLVEDFFYKGCILIIPQE